jgi:hypothetical protein
MQSATISLTHERLTRNSTRSFDSDLASHGWAVEPCHGENPARSTQWPQVSVRHLVLGHAASRASSRQSGGSSQVRRHLRFSTKAMQAAHLRPADIQRDRQDKASPRRSAGLVSRKLRSLATRVDIQMRPSSRTSSKIDR